MKVVLERKALKGLARLNEPLKSRIVKTLKGLEKEPPEGDIKPLAGSKFYRIRKGDFRIVFAFDGESIRVHNIKSRGQVYKGKGKHK
ncbi:MAG: type II toxin-antitoxin system RelE/ParE family toxin [Treponema sp.]|jgi:mRNA-degrading endonuclease RelE of RelBE toxin-antitoxin system|nr:type II toxin-antitoxin system RelE/ParE family toxin [Treponema sp.]